MICKGGKSTEWGGGERGGARRCPDECITLMWNMMSAGNCFFQVYTSAHNIYCVISIMGIILIITCKGMLSIIMP